MATSDQLANIDLSQPVRLRDAQRIVTMSYGDAIRLAEQLAAAGRLTDSRQVADQLIQRFPADLPPRWLLLQVLVAERSYAAALELAEDLTAKYSSNPVLLALCVRAFRQGGHLERALRLAEFAARRFPGEAVSQHELGLCHLGGGHEDLALAAFNEALDLQPGFIPAYWSRARIAAGRLSADQVAQMQNLLNNASLPPEDRASLQFALAWAWEGLDADRHFEHLHAANATVAALRPWNPAGARARLAWTLENVNPAMLRAVQARGNDSLAPIFVVGMPRSGTSLVEQILAAHPEVTGCGETGGFEKAILAATQGHGPGPDAPASISGAQLGAIVPRLDAAYQRSLGCHEIDTPRFTDKSLSMDWWAGLLLAMYPRARVVHCERHPLDVCLSLYQLYFTAGQEFSYDLRWAATACQIHEELMSRWKALFPGRVHTVRYEDLVRDPHRIVGELLDNCELAWADACLAFHEYRRAARTASDSQIKRPLYQRSVHRWRSYAQHLAPAAAILGIEIS